MVKNNFDKTKKYQIGFVRAEKKSTKFKNKDGGITQPSFSRTPQSIIIPGSALLEKAADFSEYLSKNPDNLPTEVIFSLYEFQPDGSLKYVDKGSPLAHQSLGDLPKEEPKKDDNSDIIALLKEYHKEQIEQMKINQDLILKQKDSDIVSLKETIEKMNEQIQNRPATSPNEEYFKTQWTEALKEISRLNDEIRGLTSDYEKTISEKNDGINELKNQLAIKTGEFERFKSQTEQAEKFNKKMETQTGEWQEKFDVLSDKMDEKAINFLETPFGQALGGIFLQKFAGANPAMVNALMAGPPNPDFGLPGNNGNGNPPAQQPVTQGTPTGKTKDWNVELDNLPDDGTMSDEEGDRM